MVESTMEALELSLLTALDETENPESGRHVRESLQLLLALEQPLEGDGAATTAGGPRRDSPRRQ
jgi:hypothetical protein